MSNAGSPECREFPVDDRHASVHEHVQGVQVAVTHDFAGGFGPMLPKPLHQIGSSGVSEGGERRVDVGERTLAGVLRRGCAEGRSNRAESKAEQVG
jgi:hypothetical protein